jgi:hypothetical protein
MPRNVLFSDWVWSLYYDKADSRTEVFDGMVFMSVLIWINDALLFAKTFEDCLQVLKEFLDCLRTFNVKLSPNKTDLCCREIKWCGRKISEAGNRFEDSRVQKWLQLPKLTTAEQLQKFVCDGKWIGTTIPSEAVSFLQELLKSLQSEGGSMTHDAVKVRKTSG